MNIEDLNIILQDELFERIDYSFKKPYAASVNKDLFIKLKQKYPELSYSEMSYLYLHKDNLQDLHIFCPVCGKKNKFIDTTEGYRHHCSYKCKANDVTVIDKIISSAKNNVDSSGLNSYQRASIQAKHTRYNDLDKKDINETNFLDVYKLWFKLFGDYVKDGHKPSEYFLSDVEQNKSFVVRNQIGFNLGDGTVRLKDLPQREYEYFWSIYNKIDSKDVLAIRQKSDRISEDYERRFTGEFYTPIEFAKKGLQYLEKTIGKDSVVIIE